MFCTQFAVSPYHRSNIHRKWVTSTPWCPDGIKVFQCIYLHHSSLHHIHILETVVIFGMTTVRKSWATEMSSMSRGQNILWKTCRAKCLRWCNDRLWLYRPLHLVFKYQLTDFAVYKQWSGGLSSPRLAARLWKYRFSTPGGKYLPPFLSLLQGQCLFLVLL